MRQRLGYGAALVMGGLLALLASPRGPLEGATPAAGGDRPMTHSLALAGAESQRHGTRRADFDLETIDPGIVAVLERLFDGMRAGDSAAVRRVFHPEARLLTIARREDGAVAISEPVDDFVRAVGAPRAQVWDERIRDVEVRIDGDMAAAWVPYEFFVGDAFSHCGVNAVQFVAGAEGWQVIQLTDTRRRKPC
jgi:hypothetical protein